MTELATKIDAFAYKHKGYSFDLIGQPHEKNKDSGRRQFCFSLQVLERENKKIEAVKVIQMSHEDIAKQEVHILKQLTVLDKDKCNLVEFYGYFFHK